MDPSTEVSRQLERFNNWGRWGPADELGTLNFITKDKRRAAAAAVVHGRAISCGRQISPVAARRDGAMMQHHMMSTGTEAPTDGRHAAFDWFGMDIHGLAFTHLDAPSHMFWNAQTYNGTPASAIGALHGAERMGVEKVASGIVTRGVLLDLPALRGASLAPGEQIAPSELLACEARQEVRVGSGDALVLRVGRDLLGGDPSAGLPGLSWNCLGYLYDREVALVCCDGVTDPTGLDHRSPSVHTVGIVGMGLWLVDNAHLEELAAACAGAGQWSFQFVVAPLRLKHATGSPVNPIALL